MATSRTKKLSFSVESILSRSSTNSIGERQSGLDRRHSCADNVTTAVVTSNSMSPPVSPLSSISAPSPLRETSLLLDDVVVQSSHNEEDTSIVAGNASRKGRMRFSPEQVQILEQRFQKQHYLLPADRKVLALSLRMSERQVKTWFQNKRAQCKRSRAFTYPSAIVPPPHHHSYHIPHTTLNTFNLAASFPYATPIPFQPTPSSPLPTFVSPAATAGIEHTPTAFMMNYRYGTLIPPTHSIVPNNNNYQCKTLYNRTSCQVTGTD